MTGLSSHAAVGPVEWCAPEARTPRRAAACRPRRLPGWQAVSAAIRSLAFAIAAWLVMPAASGDPFVVIVNPQAQTIPDREEIRDIYLGRDDDWIPLELLEGNPLRSRFHEVVTGRSASQLRSHWSRQVFTGRGYPPEEIETQEAIRYLVTEERDAIGYISPEAVTPAVKVIFRDAEPTATPGGEPDQDAATDAPR